MGMLATVMNAWRCRRHASGRPQRAVQSALNIEQVVEPYIRARPSAIWKRAGRHFRRRHRQPVFTTDTAAAHCAGSEIGAEIVLKGDQGRRYLHRRSEEGPDGDRFRRSASTRRSAATWGHGCDRVLPCAATRNCRSTFSIFKPGALKRVVMGETRERWCIRLGVRDDSPNSEERLRPTEQKMQKSLEA